MGRKHGKNTFVSLGGVNISAHTSDTNFNRSAKTHEVTGYGVDDEEYSGGLRTGKVTISGNYDSDAVTGPRTAIQPQIGQTVPFVYRVEGTGSGLPQDTVNVVVEAYNESSPVGGMVKWTADLQMSGAVASIQQA